MQIAILGPLEVRDDAGNPVEIAGGRVRALLATLALDVGKPVGFATLVDAVWVDRPPVDAQNALQTLVSRLRRLLGGPDVIVGSQTGYRLALAPDHVDAERFLQLAKDGADRLRRGEGECAARCLADALSLWRGTVAEGDLSPAMLAWAKRLDEMRRTALHDRFEADLNRGDPALVVGELEGLLAHDPLDERMAGQLIRALAGAGRQADALQVYERVRAQLADELGVDPSAALQDVHLATLRGEYGTSALPTPARRSNLRAQLTSFVGRDDEVARIGKSLEENRLVTLVGPGGAGKTRLAQEAARTIVDSVPDGVWLVELAPVSSGADVANAVIKSVGLREMNLRERHTPPSARDAHAVLLDGLADKQLLLILDNCEHLIEASATLVDQLLGECPGLRVLVTSREPLAILGEALLAVPPLGQPSSAASPVESMQFPAVRLFADRAAAVAPDFVVDDSNVAAVIEIVRRLDGLPLAIELAAARVRTTPLPDIAARLSDRFRLLTGGSRTAMPRHRTLRAVVEWSWDLLTDDERTLIEQLSVFAGGITSASAASVVGVDEADSADMLVSLADKSLLQPVDGGRRMRMLETIREYGTERLDEQGRLALARERHARHFAELTTEADAHLLAADQLPWFEVMAQERENIVAAMRFLCGAGEADGALRVSLTLGTHAMMVGAYADLTGWVAEALTVPGGTDQNLRVMAEALEALNIASDPTTDTKMVSDPDSLTAHLAEIADRLAAIDVAYSPLLPLVRGIVAFFAGAHDHLEPYPDDELEQMSEWTRGSVLMLQATVAENDGDVDIERRDAQAAYAQFRRIGERWGMSNSLRMIGQAYTLDGELDAAVEAFNEAMRLSTELGSRDDLSFVLGRLADLEVRRGDFDAARRNVALARQRTDEHGEQMQRVFTNAMLCAIELASGEHDAARELLRDSQAHLADMRTAHPALSHLRAMVLAMSARIAAEDGNLPGAVEAAQDAYSAAVETRDRPMIASIGSVTSYVAMACGDPKSAATMLGAAARVRGSDDHTARELIDLSGKLREALGDEEYERLYAEGKALGRDAAVECLAPG